MNISNFDSRLKSVRAIFCFVKIAKRNI